MGMFYGHNKNKTVHYGLLYNAYAIEDSQNVAPIGCHIPTQAELEILVTYLGGSSIAGGKLKEIGTTHWNSPNTGASNEFGFSAIAGGKRMTDGVFDFMKVEGNWWTSTGYSTLNANYLTILFNYSNTFQGYTNKKNGMSVRCVKN